MYREGESPMRRIIPAAVLLLLLTACCEPVEPDLSAYTAGPAEVTAAEESEVKYVALTFDDGPRADTTAHLLDGLAERGVRATFFVIGEQVEGNAELIGRMKAEGHQIGNHTYSHARLSWMDRDTVIEEIQKTEVVLSELLGEGSWWLRPPYGLIDEGRASLVGTPMIYWSLDPEDWKLLDARKVADYVVKNISPGDIILLHDFYPTSVDAALEIVDRLQMEGYTFVTVEELFRIQGVEPENGVLYASPTRLRPLAG